MIITRIFLDTDMRQNFDGLRKVAAKNKALLGTTLIFINTKRTMFKLLQNNQFIVYYKSSHGRIPLEVIAHLPKNFGGSDMEMNEAIRKSLATKGIE